LDTGVKERWGIPQKLTSIDIDAIKTWPKEAIVNAQDAFDEASLFILGTLNVI